MLFLYNLGIKVYYFLIFIYQFFNPKAQLWLRGRKNIFEKISNEVDPHSHKIWFHFASLGEFEQGRPVLERVKDSYPTHKIVVTFFSPSGYELRKNFKKADHIFYLPLDTSENAERFLKIFKPTLAIFTKYEFWYHFYNKLNNKNIPLIVISAIFREQQIFFKWYGSLMRKVLGFVDHFFVQDENSKKLLASLGHANVTISGDTRFDRVYQNAAAPRKYAEVESFCGNSKVFVAGSTWPEDEKLLAGLVKKLPDWKFIFAPHEIKEEKILKLEALFAADQVITLSALKNSAAIADKRVLIIDNIGMLSSLYQYGQLAYIGGGFGVGIHNTLEAAAFGIPVLFGPNYHKFLEAKALISLGAGFSISTERDLTELAYELQDEDKRIDAGKKAGKYVSEQQGATDSIMQYIDKILQAKQ